MLLFLMNIGFQGVVSFTLEELKGVPEDVVSGYTKRTEDGKEVYDVTFKTPDIFPIVCTVHFVSLQGTWGYLR